MSVSIQLIIPSDDCFYDSAKLLTGSKWMIYNSVVEFNSQWTLSITLLTGS